MISSENYKTIHIHITTYKGNLQKLDTHFGNMNVERKDCTSPSNKFICSICLNPNQYNENFEDERTIAKTTLLPAPKSYNCCLQKPKARIKGDNEKRNKYEKANTVNKAVQTSHTDLNKSFNLLHEVLAVFQNKKLADAKETTKNVLKDAFSSTDDIHIKPKLSITKAFKFSIDDAEYDRDEKFTIITSHEDFIRSKCSVDLPKHKSSSVPQMKLEELKNSVKEKTKSKDAIEEVNRMFATVKKKRPEFSEDSNRPLVRNGPRILPVVKSKEDADHNICQCESRETLPHCSFCYTGDCFSSGDSIKKPEYCHHKQHNEKSDKFVYTMCCNYKNYRNAKSSVMYCEHCRKEKHSRFYYNKNDSYFDKNS